MGGTLCLILYVTPSDPYEIKPADREGLNRTPHTPTTGVCATHLEERFVLHPQAVEETLPQFEQLVTCKSTWTEDRTPSHDPHEPESQQVSNIHTLLVVEQPVSFLERYLNSANFKNSGDYKTN